MVWLQQLRYLNEQISGGPEQYLSFQFILEFHNTRGIRYVRLTLNNGVHAYPLTH